MADYVDANEHLRDDDDAVIVERLLVREGALWRGACASARRREVIAPSPSGAEFPAPRPQAGPTAIESIMANTTPTNPYAGTGQHSHSIPAIPGVVVVIRDGHHAGTSVWQQDDDTRTSERKRFVFAQHDRDTLDYAERCVLVVGQDSESLSEPYGCDGDPPRGLALVGVAVDDDLSWLDEGAEVLWDSLSVTYRDAAREATRRCGAGNEE